MKEITVKKEDLIEAIESNMQKYKELYAAMKTKYFENSRELLYDAISKIEAGSEKRVIIDLHLPTNQEDGYKNVISMLKMDVSDTVTLDQNEYAKYVLNEWNWKKEFVASAAALLITTNNRYYGYSGYSGSAGKQGNHEESEEYILLKEKLKGF
jgi:hypothetical protein